LSRQLLLISSFEEDQKFAAEVARFSGMELLISETLNGGVDQLVNSKPDVTFFKADSEEGYRQFEDRIQESVGLFSDAVNANGLHFLSSSDISKVGYLLKSPIFGHFVSCNYGDPVLAGRHYGRVVRSTLADKAFGLEQLFGSDVVVQTIRFEQTGQKLGAVEAVRNYLLAAKFKARMASIVSNSVDELLMNAMFDAPTDELGRQQYLSESRATQRKLKDQDAVEMHVAFDGDYVAVSTVDHYGSLDKTKLMAHISKVYTEEEYKVKTTVAGAGLGLATVFRSGGSFFFISETNSKTEAMVFFKRTSSFREFKDQFRFVSTQFYF